MLLEWRDRPPIPERPDLLIWTSLTEREASLLRDLAVERRVIEVGAAFGFSTLLLASVAVRVWSIDPHNAPPATRGNYNFERQEDMDRYAAGTLPILTANLASAKLEDRVHVIRELSQRYLPTFAAKEADFAFIDGDHGLAAATEDLHQCERIIGKGGMIAVHDYQEALNPEVKPAVDGWLAGRPMQLVDTLAVVQI